MNASAPKSCMARAPELVEGNFDLNFTHKIPSLHAALPGEQTSVEH